MKFLIPLLFACMVPSVSQAISVQRISADIKNLTFVDDRGEAEARDLFVEIGEAGISNTQRPRRPQVQTLYIFRQGKDLEIQTGFTTVFWRNLPNWLTIDLNLRAKDVVAKLGYSPAHTITARELHVTKPSLGNAKFHNLNVVCTPVAGQNAEFEKILAQCLTKGKITGGKFDIPTLKEFLARDVMEDPESVKELREIGENLDVQLNDNKFSLVVTTFLAKIKLRVLGTIVLNENTKLASVKLDNIRFGKLDVTKIAFPVLKELISTEGVSVKAPYIHIQL